MLGLPSFAGPILVETPPLIDGAMGAVGSSLVSVTRVSSPAMPSTLSSLPKSATKWVVPTSALDAAGAIGASVISAAPFWPTESALIGATREARAPKP